MSSSVPMGEDSAIVSFWQLVAARLSTARSATSLIRGLIIVVWFLFVLWNYYNCNDKRLSVGSMNGGGIWRRFASGKRLRQCRCY